MSAARRSYRRMMKTVDRALVFSAGGMFAAWEAGVWKAICGRFQPSMIVGASAGAWNGWAVAGGCTPDELIQNWLDPETARIMQFGWHRMGCMRPETLHRRAQEMAERFQPRIPFGLTITRLPGLQAELIRDAAVTWRHLAATAAIPFCFPPVEIDGRLYVDGGVNGGLPLWAAEQMGATRALGLNVLTSLPFRMLRTVMRPRPPSPALQVEKLEPSTELGSLHDGAVWSLKNIVRWIEMGERDGAKWQA